MNFRTIRTAAVAAVVLTLAACGGGGSGPGSPMHGQGSGEMPAAFESLLDRTDSLLFSAVHSRWSGTLAGEPVEDAAADAVICVGARCTGPDGMAIEAGKTTIVAIVAGRGPGDATLGSRDGFDTVTATDRFEIGEKIASFTITASASATTYGFWGEHGFAALTLGAGPLSGEAEGAPFAGEFGIASAYAAGDASGSNPTGLGSAAWHGIAEAARKDAFERLRGTATVTIADLSRPRVGVTIDVPGHAIGAPGWTDMALDEGRFASGSAGTDWLSGSFHGPGHEEAWGVFDTTGHVGSFGAKREQ
ncbi:MAG: hypothetical protein OXF33_14070 [Rhodospirillales bacterium]|nr:hypothetical protein [Rhodospirillales bacterium]